MRSVGVIGSVAVTLALVMAFLGHSPSRSTRGVPAKPQRILQYRCPMHPSDVSEAPGTSACGMAFVPVYGEVGSGSNSTSDPTFVALTDGQQQLAGIRLTPVESASVTATLRTLGRVEVDEGRDYRVTAAADGWIVSISPDATTGGQVREGDALATVSGRDYTTPQRAFLYAMRDLESTPPAQRRVGLGQGPGVLFDEALLDLRRLGFGNRQIEEIKATRDVQLNIILPAPASGVVIARNVYPQQGFVKGAELFRVADLRQVWILADVSGDGVDRIKSGDAVHVSLPDRPQPVFRATVSDALPLFNHETRTLKVRLVVENPRLILRPDMFVNLEFTVKMPEALTVPDEAIRESGLGSTVFVSRGHGAFEARSVDTGWRLGNRVQVVKGLSVGDTIVESGNFLLDSERRLRGVVSHPHD